jgi:hypothetical protein
MVESRVEKAAGNLVAGGFLIEIENYSLLLLKIVAVNRHPFLWVE